MIHKLYFAYKISLSSPFFPMLFVLMVFCFLFFVFSSFRQMIQAAIKNTEKGALLTTHCLAAAEAICDRIAIMVSGRLRWVSFHSFPLTPQTRFPMKRGQSPWEAGVPFSSLSDALSLTFEI